MSDFQLFFTLGFRHITDLAAYDHLLFLIALCATLSIDRWGRLLGVTTAFSVGHTLTLFLSVKGILSVDPKLIEFLIPVTIFITAMSNIIGRNARRGEVPVSYTYRYIMALVFGCIHGLGFSNYFKFLVEGIEKAGFPLFSFTAGIEIGQICIVAALFLVAYLFRVLFFFRQNEWNLFVSGAAAGISIILMATTGQELFFY